jgi:hypothetical protein
MASGLSAPVSRAATAPPPCVSSAADERAAAAVAVACRIRVEVLAGRSEYTQSFINPDGTSTFVASAVPARVRKGDGTWVGVDTALRTRSDGMLAPTASVADVAFSRGGSAPFATYREAGATLSLSWPSALPVPTVDGSTAVYANVLPEVDLRVTATATGFQPVLVVRSRAAAANPALSRIRVQVGGDVVARSTSPGRVRFANRAGATVAVTDPALMWDSTVNPGSGGEVLPGVDLAALRANPPAALVSTADGPGATAVTGAVGVVADASNGLVLTPDAAMLGGAGTTFPLFIDPQIGPQRTKWAYSRSVNSNYTMDGKAWVGKNPPCCGGDGTLFRAFFDFPTTYNGQTYKGKHILAASFSIMLYHSYSCSNTTANLYRVGSITVANAARMNWTTRPLGSAAVFLGGAGGHANKAGGCGSTQPDMLMTFGGNSAMRTDVQTAATSNWNTYTVGICACDSNDANESTQDRWKKFRVDNNTAMSVTYNTVPGTPANLSPHQGQVACGGVVGTSSPVLQAQYVDADGGDTLSASFKWQQLPSGTVTTVAGPSRPANNNGTVTLNLGSSAEGKSYQFQVQTNDGHDSSPWSSWCSFTVDTTAPPGPVVTPSGSGPVYAACDPGNINSCTANGGPGVAGAFTFSEPAGSAGQDVVSYVYGWDSPSKTVTVSAGAAYGPILLTPPRYGINTLAVYSVDGSGKQSATTSYKFLVASPSSYLAHWALDSLGSHYLTDEVSGASLTATGTTWTADARYMGADALTFNGSAQATQTVSAFDTSGSFSVAAWARLSSLTCSTKQTVVSIDADSVTANNHVTGMALGYDCTSQKWRIGVPDQNRPTPSYAEALDANVAIAGQWTFLVGVWDENEQTIRLYVNGALVQTVTPSSTWLAARGAGWRATGPVTIGRHRFNDADGNHFVGDIADVRVWNRVVVPDDINGTNADPANGVPAHVGFASPLQVGSWQIGDGECFCTDTADVSPFSRKLFLVPNWSLDPGFNGDPATAPAWFTGESADGNGGIRLDGVRGFASTTDDMGTWDTADDVLHPILRTDQSLTISARAKLDQATTVDQMVACQGDFCLFYRGWDHKWGVTVFEPDGTLKQAISNSVAATGSWVHLVGEFDAATGQVRLWVNNVSQSYANTGAVGYPSTESLAIGSRSGTGFFFGGVIDQVQVYQGLLNAREIKNIFDAI